MIRVDAISPLGFQAHFFLPLGFGNDTTNESLPPGWPSLLPSSAMPDTLKRSSGPDPALLADLSQLGDAPWRSLARPGSGALRRRRTEARNALAAT